MAKRTTTADLLPEHLLALIAERLDLVDSIRFGYVCRSWKSILPPVNHGKKHIPWLLNHIRDIQNQKTSSQNGKSLGFFFLNSSSSSSSSSSSDVMNGDDQDGNKNQFYVLERPEISERIIRGSCQGGWLVTVHEKNGAIQLFHPFSRGLINLPPLPKFEYEKFGVHFNKFVMSPMWSSSSSNNSSVMRIIAIHSNGRKLAFCKVNRKVADDQWTPIKDDNLNLINPGNCYHDVTYFKGLGNRYHDVAYYKGQFYVVHSFGEVVVVKNLDDHCLDIDRLPYATEVASKPEYEDFRPNPYFRFLHLVECSGELLLVIKWALTHEMYIGPTGKEEIRPTDWRIVFKVFKLDFSSSSSSSSSSIAKWVEVKSLGDHSIFLSGYRSFCVSIAAADRNPCCQRNCIYFTDQYTIFRNYKIFRDQSICGGHDIGIFHMEDGKLERCYPSGSTAIVPHPIWYTTYNS